MKKLLSLLAAGTIVVSAGNSVIACNTKTVDQEYKGLSSLKNLWNNSYIKSIPINAFKVATISGEEKTFEGFEATIKKQLVDLFSFRMADDTKWIADSSNPGFKLEIYYNEVILLNNDVQFNALIEKYEQESISNFYEIPLTFNIAFDNASVNDLDFKITSRQAILFNIDKNESEISKSTLTITNPVEFLELKSSTGKQVLWLDDLKIKDKLTVKELEAIVYDSLLPKININNYSVYINKVFQQISADKFENKFAAKDLVSFLNYLIKPFYGAKSDEILEYKTGNEANENIHVDGEDAVTEITDFLLFGAKVTLKSIKSFKIVSTK